MIAQIIQADLIFCVERFLTIFHRSIFKNHIVRSWKSLRKGKELPSLPSEDDKFNRKVSFYEATSESIIQFTFGDIIIRTYGISDDTTTRFFQLFSLASSMVSLMVAFISVSRFMAIN